MLASTVALFFAFALLSISYGSLQNECSAIMNTFYQTEDQYFDLDCSNPEKLVSNMTLTYHCRSLQKKMDIFGSKYYDFQVSTGCVAKIVTV